MYAHKHVCAYTYDSWMIIFLSSWAKEGENFRISLTSLWTSVLWTCSIWSHAWPADREQRMNAELSTCAHAIMTQMGNEASLGVIIPLWSCNWLISFPHAHAWTIGFGRSEADAALSKRWRQIQIAFHKKFHHRNASQMMTIQIKNLTLRSAVRPWHSLASKILELWVPSFWSS